MNIFTNDSSSNLSQNTISRDSNQTNNGQINIISINGTKKDSSSVNTNNNTDKSSSVIVEAKTTESTSEDQNNPINNKSNIETKEQPSLVN